MWLTYAVLAAVLWGINYALAERILHSISPSTLLALEMLAGAILFSCVSYFTTMKKDLQLLAADPAVFWLTLTEIAVVLLATYFIASSIFFKNATIAGLIELIYPLFTLLFTWLIFGENHLDSSVILGGVLIFIGVLIIALD